MKFTEVVGMIVLVVLAIVAVLGFVWVVQGSDFFLHKYFDPKYEDMRRETFEHSKAYNQGMIQELQNMQFEYAKASPEHKDALASVILHRTADYDLERLPPHLAKFIEDLRDERLLAR